ncbi:transcriptional regulator [Citreicella sp. 357]|nr:transcriptional regulator [Citreicella sp. 357]
MMDRAPEKLVRALVNGIAILRYLQRACGGVGVTQAARDLGINPSTCFNLLRTLVHEGLVSFDPFTKTYALSMGVVSLAQGALAGDNHIHVLHPELQRLSLKFGVAMNLWRVVSEDRVVLVDRTEPTATVQISMRIGQRLPLFTGAFGRCFAAQSPLPRAAIERRFKKIRLARPPDFDQWFAGLDHVREVGLAVDRGNFAIGITTVAITLPGPRDQPFLAVSAIGISEQIDDAKLESLSRDMLRLGV